MATRTPKADAPVTTDRDAIVARLTAYAADATKAGVAAGRDLAALTDGLAADAFETEVIAKIGALRLGRVMPVVDRILVVKAWRDTNRVGGRVDVKVCAAALGISTGQVSTDANSGDQPAEPTTRAKADDEVLATINADFKKAVAKIDAPTKAVMIELQAIELEARRALVGLADRLTAMLAKADAE